MINYQNFKLMSWNATGIMSSSRYLCDTLRKFNIDFCGISEHCLFVNCFKIIEQIESNYKSVQMLNSFYSTFKCTCHVITVQYKCTESMLINCTIYGTCIPNSVLLFLWVITIKKTQVSSQNGRDLYLLKFLADTNFVAIVVQVQVILYSPTIATMKHLLTVYLSLVKRLTA